MLIKDIAFILVFLKLSPDQIKLKDSIRCTGIEALADDHLMTIQISLYRLNSLLRCWFS